MISPKKKRNLLSGYLMMRATWPYGLGEAIANVLGPVVNRIVFLLLLLANFRYFGRHVKESMNFSEVFVMVQPILWSVVAVMVLPVMVEILGYVSRRGRKRRTNDRLLKKYCYILFGSTRFNDNWKSYYRGQLMVVEYVIYILVLAPVFMFYSWPIFVNLFIVSNLYVATCVGLRFTDPESRLAKFENSAFYVIFMKNLFFCIYLLISAVIIWQTPGRFPLEFLFLLIVGMRMFMRKASALAAMLRSGQLKVQNGSSAVPDPA